MNGKTIEEAPKNGRKHDLTGKFAVGSGPFA